VDLTGFVFFTIEQSVKEALKPSLSPNFESKGDHTNVHAMTGYICPKPLAQ